MNHPYRVQLWHVNQDLGVLELETGTFDTWADVQFLITMLPFEDCGYTSLTVSRLGQQVINIRGLK